MTGDVLKRLREAYGLSQADVARASGKNSRRCYDV